MKIEDFRPSYPSDGGLGYRLGRDLWAECVEHREYDEGQELAYIVYTGSMVGMPAVPDVHRLVRALEAEGYRPVVVTDEKILVDRVRRRQARLVYLDCWEGVPGA